MKKGTIRFNLFPLLLLLIPIVQVILSLFPLYRDEGFVCAIVDGQGVDVSKTMAIETFRYVGGADYAMYCCAMVVSALIAIYGILASLFPKLRRMKVCGPVFIVLFTALMTFTALSCILALPVIEERSAEYAHLQRYDLEASQGYTHASLFFYLLMGMPLIYTVWWGWSLAILHKAEKKGLLEETNGEGPKE